MWVADMDFACPPEVIGAIEARLKHPLLGYPVLGDRYYQSIIAWQKRRCDWELEPAEIGYIGNVMGGIVCALRAFTSPGDAVLFLAPGYPAFAAAASSNRRRVVSSLLFWRQGRWEIDFDDFESKIIDNKIQLFVLSSPHNPTGRSWSADELKTLGDLCEKHRVLVVSDEIHADLTHTGVHIPIAGLGEDYAQNTITLCAPTKTFNLAGLSTGYAVIRNPAVRRHFFAEVNASEFITKNVLGIEAMIAAYSSCAQWLDELNVYLHANAAFACSYLSAALPVLKAVMPEATYLLWIDFSRTGFPHEQVIQKCTDEAHLYLSDGRDFICGGEGFLRMNLACPRTRVQEALERLTKIF